jgi:hypothetical protein
MHHMGRGMLELSMEVHRSSLNNIVFIDSSNDSSGCIIRGHYFNERMFMA